MKEEDKCCGLYISRCEKGKFQEKEWVSHDLEKAPGVCSEKPPELEETARKLQGTRKGPQGRSEKCPGVERGGRQRHAEGRSSLDAAMPPALDLYSRPAWLEVGQECEQVPDVPVCPSESQLMLS